MRKFILFLSKKLIKLTNRDLYLKIKEGTFDDETSRFIERNKVDLIIDVGANRGDFAARLIENGFKGPILSFEPMPATFEILSARAAHHANWHCFQLALGESETKSIIHGHKEDVFTSLLEPSQYGKKRFKTLNEAVDVEVSIRRLDNVIEELIEKGVIAADFRAFMKVDTQGYDLNVIRGTGAFIEQMALLQTEASIKAIYEGTPDYTQTFLVLKELGFNPASFNVLSRDKGNGNIIEFDLLVQREPA